jgi:uncharacterized protein YndB with AHSA1/START domain
MNSTVEALINAPIEKVQSASPSPQDIKQRNAASDDWRSTAASVDLREGGALSLCIEAKGGSFGFDFAGTYTKIILHQRIEQTPSTQSAQDPGEAAASLCSMEDRLG